MSKASRSLLSGLFPGRGCREAGWGGRGQVDDYKHPTLREAIPLFLAADSACFPPFVQSKDYSPHPIIQRITPREGKHVAQ